MKKCLVLIFEDEGIMALNLSMTLEMLGYDVAEPMECGRSASDAVQKLQPDLIFMDITLADGVGGIDAARAIREHSSVPIIFTTGHSDPGAIAKMDAIKHSTYLIKPFSYEDVSRVVESFKLSGVATQQ